MNLKTKIKKRKKFKFLLDTAFAHPIVFKKLKSKSNLKHVRHDYNLSGQTDDKDIYNLAVQEGRFVITQDDGFRKHIKKNKLAVIIVPSYLTTDEMDTLISDFISGKNPDDFLGKAIKI